MAWNPLISRQDILQHHQDKMKIGRRNEQHCVNVGLSMPTSQKTPGNNIKAPEPDLDELLPVRLEYMVLGKKHSGRFIRGELIVDPLISFGLSVHSVIEDEKGHVTFILFHNLGDLSKSYNEFAEKFAKGGKVIIREPFYERMFDGYCGIQIDDFEDVFFVDKFQPIAGDDPEDWKALGNRHFKASQFGEASDCYKTALSKCHPDVTAVLNEASITLRRLGDPWSALQHAVAAIRTSSQSWKAYYRASEALKDLDCAELVLFFCEEAQSKITDEDEKNACVKLKEKFIKLAPSAANKDASSRGDCYEACLYLIIEHEPFLKRSFDYDLENPVESSVQSNNLSDAKNNGNLSYSEGELEKALSWYQKALASEQTKLVDVLLSNLALCGLKQDNFIDAAFDALAALVIDAKSEKAFHRLATALTKMDEFSGALSVLKNAPPTEAIAQLRKSIEIKLKIEDERTLDPVAEKRQMFPTESEWKKAFDSGNRMSTDQLVMSNLRFESVLRASGLNLKAFDDRVVNFHEKFAAEGNWPRGCDVSECREKLREAYENSRTRQCEFVLFHKSLAHEFERFFLEEKRQRCNYNDEIISKLQNATVGDVFTYLKPEYNLTINHSFSNQPRTLMKVLGGTTHVSVGFVDLGELLNIEIEPKEGQSFKWVGYEASEYAVAKTLVINEMLKLKLPAMDIMQVWFSATWNHQGFSSFRRALNKVLKEGLSSSEADSVNRVLIHWKCQNEGVPLKTARKLWLQFHPDQATVIASMKKVCDQRAMCSYIISGDLISNPTIGSVVMFSLPPDVGQICLDESVFHCIPSEILFKYRLKKGCKNIVCAAVNFLTEKIDILSNKLNTGEIITDIQRGMVCLENIDLLRKIRMDLKPASMRWSNVCDYFAPKEFHTLATVCSQMGTKHYMSPMSWSTEVCGGFVLDYAEVEERISLREQSIIYLKRNYEKHGMLDYLHVPPMGHPMYLVNMFLGTKYNKKWAKKFVKESEVPVERVEVEQLFFYTDLMKMCPSFALSYTYKQQDS